MSNFLIQNDPGTLDFETMIVKDLLENEKYTHDFSEMGINELKYRIESENIATTLIPIGTIEFVSLYIKYAYGVETMNPIEIPKYLRTEEFLKRKYEIVTYDKIPKAGEWFIKDVSRLKKFGMVLDTTYQLPKDVFDEPKTEFDTSLRLNKNHLYQVSEVFDIQSEYRVYVIDGKIQAISHYNGNPLILPDVNLIQKAVMLIECHEKWLKSYTIDVMVGSKGTAIVEIHNFTSVGLYSTLWGTNLLYAYRDGIDYLTHDNRQMILE
jgi:hypothetical protein